MKERCFLFKCIDHERKKILKVEILVYDNKVSEWVQNDDDVQGYVEWLTKHALFEKKLKEKIREILISIRYFNPKAGKYGDYKIVKEITKKENEMVRLEEISENTFKVRGTNYKESYITKMERGPKPENWKDIFNYPKSFEHYMYLLNSSEMDDEIRLTQLGDKIAFEVIHTGVMGKNTGALESVEPTGTVQSGGRREPWSNQEWKKKFPIY